MTPRPIFLGYARKSWIDSKNRKELESTERQIARLTAWAAEQDIELELYAEPDGRRSGGSIEHRPAYQQMLRRITTARPGELAGVVATVLDRTGRDELDMFELFDEIVTRNLRIAVLDDPSLDLDSTDGRFLAGLKVILAAQERRRVADRMRESSADRMVLGIYVGSPPYGYRWTELRNEQNQRFKTLEPVPEEVERLTAIFQKYTAGYGVQSVAQWCNLLGWTTRRGKLWDAGSIYELIRHLMTYRGYVLFRKKHQVVQMVEGRHPPIIEQELADAVLASQRGRSPALTGGRRDGRQYPLAHRIWCAECGSAIVGNTRVSDGKQPFPEPRMFYRCTKNRGVCAARRVVATEIETQVWARLIDDHAVFMRAAATMPELADLVPRRPLPEPSAAASVRAEMDRLNLMFRKGRISEEQYDRDYEVLERRLAVATASVNTIGSHQDPFGLLAMRNIMADLHLALEHGTRERLPAVARALIERVEVLNGEVVLCQLIPALEQLRAFLSEVQPARA